MVMLIGTSGECVIGTSDDQAYCYVEWWDCITSVASDDTTNNNDGEGASATEPNRRTEGESVYWGVAEIVINDDGWALAKEEETDNNVNGDNNDDNVNNQALRSTNNGA